MNTDELSLLRETTGEFMVKHKDEIESMEKTGISRVFMERLSKAGILASRMPVDLGGSELPDEGYFVILNELAKHSPSVAVLVMMVNSLFYPLSKNASDKEVFHGISEGKLNPAVSFLSASESHKWESKISLVGDRLTGREEFVLNSNCDVGLFVFGNEDSKVALVKNGLKPFRNRHRLGLNGLEFSAVDIDSEDYEVLGNNGLELVSDAMDSIDLELSAISLGIAEGPLQMAVDYAQQRKAFGQLLKDYGPLSGRLGKLKYEVQYLVKALQSGNLVDKNELIALKLRALEIAEEATTFSIQVHGGYGYFEEFHVEKYYRDLNVIESLFFRQKRDKERLAGFLYGEKSGFL